MQLRKWIVREPQSRRDRLGCLIVLPGRNVPGTAMLRFCREMELRRTLLVALQPPRLRWYPQPNGPDDQAAAADGLPHAVEAAAAAVGRIQKAFDLKSSEVALLGFSAGAVVAVQVAAAANESFAACVALAGAMLEPAKTAPAKNDTLFVLQHNLDDLCFKFHERFVPMKAALATNGYRLTTLVRPVGGHTLYINDAVSVGRILAERLGYPKSFAVKYLLPKICGKSA